MAVRTSSALSEQESQHSSKKPRLAQEEDEQKNQQEEKQEVDQPPPDVFNSAEIYLHTAEMDDALREILQALLNKVKEHSTTLEAHQVDIDQHQVDIDKLKSMDAHRFFRETAIGVRNHIETIVGGKCGMDVEPGELQHLLKKQPQGKKLSDALAS